MKCRFLFLAILFTAANANAAERYEYYNGVRMLGMGGAGVATVNDETALLVNPAALGKLRDYFFTIVDPELDVSSEAEQIAGTKLMDVVKPQEMLTLANANVGRHLHSRAQVFPSVVIPNFGFGLFAKSEVNAETVEGTPNTFKYHYTSDWAGVLGVNAKFFDGRIKIGANMRVTNRATIRRDDIDVASTGLTIKNLAAEGIGIGSDAGILMTAPIKWLPTIGAVYRDVGRTNYTYQEGLWLNSSTRPDSVPSTVDVAMAIYPILSNRVRSTWTIEYQDVLTYGDETSQMRRVHGGVEFNFADAFFLRGGMNQKFWTAGVELSMMNYQFQVASYGEDIGTAAVSREDRRYVVKFAFRF